LNRKEGVIVGLVLLVSFVGGASAAPAIQQTFIMNDPLNVRIVGGTTTQQTTSLDIAILSLAPGLMSPSGDSGIVIRTSIEGVAVRNLTAGFSFAPVKGFSQITQAMMTVVTGYGTINALPVGLNVVLNSQAPILAPLDYDTFATTTIPIPIQDVRLGLNTLSMALLAPANPNGGSFVFVYEVRLTVEYTFLG